jgi:hypothetical protein
LPSDVSAPPTGPGASADFWLKLLVGSTVLALAVQIYAGAVLRGAYGDGAFFMTHIAAQGGISIIQPARYFSELITQAPVVLAMRLGLRDPNAVALAFSLSTNILPGLITLCCLPALPKGRRRLFVFPAFVFLAGILCAQFESVTEGLVATPYFWLLLCLISFGRLTFLRSLLILALTLGSLNLHEQTMFLSPILVASCLLRLREEAGLRPKLVLLVAALGALASAVVGADYAFHPLSVRERGGLIDSMLNFEWLYIRHSGLNLICALGILAALCIIAVMLRPAIGRAVVLLFSLVAILSALAAFKVNALVVPSAAFDARDIAAFMSLPAGILLIVSRLRPGFAARSTQNAVLGIVAALGLSASVWHAAATRDWLDFRSHLVMLLQSRTGIVPWSTVISSAEPRQAAMIAKMMWPWSNPDLSLVLLPRAVVTSIIANPESYSGWQPYALSDPGTLPKIPHVTYDYLPRGD